MKSIYFDVSVPKILATKALAGLLPFVYFTPLSPVGCSDIPEQRLPGKNWVRVKSTMTGICGADIAMFFVKASPKISIAALPGVPRAFMGHEVVGTVVEKGTGVTSLALGDRVILERYLPCCSTKEINPPCRPCTEGNYTLCENFSEGALPPSLGAGFSEHFLAHKTQLVKVGPDISDDQAVLVEPTAVSLHAVLSRPPRSGEKVLIIGAGTIGLGVIQISKALGKNFTLYALEKIPFKKELARKYGADYVLDGDPYEAMAKATGARLYRGPLGNNTTLGGFDLIYDCVGYSATIHDSLRWLRAKGDYVMIGNQLSPVSFDQTPVWQQELTMKGINAHGAETYQGKKTSSFALAIDLIRKKQVRVDGLITHRFPFADYKEAFKLAKEKSGDVIKVVLKIS